MSIGHATIAEALTFDPAETVQLFRHAIGDSSKMQSGQGVKRLELAIAGAGL